jgi:hypothetical protein
MRADVHRQNMKLLSSFSLMPSEDLLKLISRGALAVKLSNVLQFSSVLDAKKRLHNLIFFVGFHAP